METENIKNELEEMPMNKLEKITAKLSFVLVIGGFFAGGLISYATKDASNVFFYGLVGIGLGNLPIGVAAISYSLRMKEYTLKQNG